MYSVYYYDEDNGELVGTIKDVAETLWKKVAQDYRNHDYLVKVVDQFDGAVIYTLG